MKAPGWSARSVRLVRPTGRAVAQAARHTQQRLALAAALLLRDRMAISLAVVPTEER
jgi:hypothetical protein